MIGRIVRALRPAPLTVVAADVQAVGAPAMVVCIGGDALVMVFLLLMITVVGRKTAGTGA